MKILWGGKWRRKPGWLRKLFCGGALGLSFASGSLLAQTPPEPTLPKALPLAAPTNEIVLVAQGPSAMPFVPTQGPINLDPLAPAWVDPVSRVPNMFGGFYARSLLGSQAGNTVITPLHFTGVGAEGGGFVNLIPNGPVTGPKGPYNLKKNIPLPNPIFQTFTLPQNTELTNQVQMKFPGVSFLNGGGTFLNFRDAAFFYNYLSTTTTPALTANLPNPIDGGLVGRNLYFENGTALPQDRVYFFYNHVGNFQQSGPLDINRYVFGAEKTFFDGMVSVELRVPFAGTANRDQIGGQAMSVDHAEFGNIGLAVKGVLYRTPNFAVSIGLGVTLPTAGSSQMLIAGTPIIEIQNRTYLLQPMLGLAWAPNDRFFAQAGLQFDIDPSGNPVRGLNGDGGLSRIGTLHDPGFVALNVAAGYWAYLGNGGRLTAVALQTELDYYGSFGAQDAVQLGALTIRDTTGSVNVLNITPSAIFEFDNQTRLSFGVSLPLTSDRLYNWALTVQLNYKF